MMLLKDDEYDDDEGDNDEGADRRWYLLMTRTANNIASTVLLLMLGGV